MGSLIPSHFPKTNCSKQGSECEVPAFKGGGCGGDDFVGCFTKGGFDMPLIVTNFKHICKSICCVKCFSLTILDYRLILTTQLTSNQHFPTITFNRKAIVSSSPISCT